MKKVSGKIEEVELKKSGETDGRKWKIFTVMIDGAKFGTFDEAFVDMVGEHGTWEYTEEDVDIKGKTYKRRTLTSAEKIDDGPEENREGLKQINIAKGLGVIRGDIKRVEKKIDALLTRKTENEERSDLAGNSDWDDIPVHEE